MIITEEQFLKTMIETVKYEDYEPKSDLLAILRNSIITFDKTTSFTRKSYQYWENIDLRVPIPMLKNARELQRTLNAIAEDIYIESEQYDFYSLRIKPKPVELESDNHTEYDVAFDEIKDTIIQGIRGAKYIIWAAVAWITDRDIYNELLLKKEAGINVRIITSNDDSNRWLMKELIANFDTVAIPKWGTHLMHNKFCIIDFDYVMHGSYNWSKNAEGNEETLSTALDRDFVCKFLDQFVHLYSQYKDDDI